MSFSIVIASTSTGGIGFQGQLPWKCPEDLRYFRHLTTTVHDPQKRNAIVMGRKTWDSLVSQQHAPLPRRWNVVISKTLNLTSPDTLVCTSLDKALECLSCLSNVESIFVIGGSQLYQEAIQHPQCQTLNLTQIHQTDVICDVGISLPPPPSFTLTDSRETPHCTFQIWIRRCYPQTKQELPQPPTLLSHPNTEEQQYLDIVKDILQTGHRRGDRTGTGVISKFGYTMRFDLKTFPLLTTKKVFFRGVAEELLWFLKGHTNAKLLRDRGVKIWDGNASRAYLDSIGLKDRSEDDLGPIYGFQWRHFGAQYKTMHDDYTGQGVDQIQDLIQRIRKNPTDRRLVLTAWNPTDIPSMALPPCHCLCQFYVREGKLSCQMYQRSCDMGLGVPFNMASYALLTCVMAHVCDLQPGEFIHVMGDAHIYVNHIDAMREQLKRAPRAFPTLTITADHRNLEQFQLDDFVIDHYHPGGKLSMTMAV